MRPVSSATLLPLVLGLSDGILNALTLTAGRLIRRGAVLQVGLTLRVAAVAFVTGAFVFFVARYAELRRELAHAERQLSLRRRGRLAIPLGAGLLIPSARWISIAVAMASLAGLGVLLARLVYGNPFLSAAGLVLAGALLTGLGVLLRIT